MKNILKIKVTTKHFREATQYVDVSNCPLARAIKDKFPNSKISICIGVATIDYVDYELSFDWCSAQKIYGGKLKNLSINDMIDMAKNDESIVFPTKTLVLRKI